MNGLNRGLQLMADFLKLFVRAVRSGQLEAVTDCISVAEQWLSETVNTVGVVKVNTLGLLFGADPWIDSRKKYQKVHDKWANRL